MLELDKLIFATDTSQLDTAVKKLGDLQTAVVNLNKPMDKAALASEKLAQAQAKTSKANADATASAAKAELAQSKLVKQTEKQTSTTKNSLSVLEKQQQILEFMTQGFSKGQATVLTYAKAAGAAAGELKTLGEVQQTMRKLQGGDPFDKSVSGLVSLKNSLMEAREANRLYTAGIDLTSAQTKELARDKQRLIEAMKINGASFDMIKQKLRDHNAEYIKVSEAVNRLDRAEKAKMQTDRETGKATDYLSREMQRAENALAGLNNEVAISSSNRLLRFKEGLIAAGVATDVAAERYKAYAKVIADTDAKRKAQQKSDEQSRIDNLSRGLAPQISDVAVSLYGGMSPMTVLMQQGLQVRDLIQSSGVEAGKLNEVMRKTGADFVSTLTGTFKAVGSMVVGTLQSAGANVTKFAMDTTGAGLVLENFRYQAMLASKDADSLTASLGKAALSFSNFVTSASSALVGGGIAAGIVALVTAIAVTKQLIKEESELSKVLNLNGAALGLNRDAAYSLAAAYAGARGDINGFAEAISESAKAGNIISDSLQTVTQSAVYMKSVGGVAIADTVKQFSEIAKDPVKALEKLAISLGTIDPEILKVVRSLEEQGKQAQAASIATAAYAEGLAKAGAGIKNDMGFLESFFKTIGSAASSMWDKILNVGREGTLQQQIDSVKEKISSLAAGEGVFILSDRNVVLGIEKAKLEGLEKQLAAQVALNNQKERNVALIKNDSEVNKLLDQYAEKSDKKKKAIEEVNNVFNESIRLAKEDGKAVAEIEANRGKALVGIEEKFKVRTKKDPQENYFANLMLEAEKATVKAADATDELTKSQERMLVLIQDSRFLALPKDKQALALASFASTAAQEVENKEWEAANKIMDETSKAMKQATIEADKLRIAREQRGESEVLNAQNKLTLLDEELADMLLQKSIYGQLSVEQKKSLEYAKAQKEYKAEELRINKLLADPKNNINSDDANRLRAINLETLAKKQQNIDQAIILENLKFEANQRKEIAMAFGEAIATSLFEGGKAGTKKLKSFIESELRNRITLQIQANVETSMEGNTGVNQIVQAGANFGSTLSTQGFGSALSGGVADIADFMADQGFLDFAESLDSVAGKLSEFAPAINQTVGYLGAFNTALEGDYGAAIGEGIGFAVGGPIGAAIGKEIGSWLGLTEGGGTAHMGGYGAYSATGGSVKGSTLRGAAGAQFGLADDSIKAASNTMLAGVAQGIVSILDDTANAFGKQAGYYAATSFADDTSDDGAWGALAIKLGDKVLTDWADTQTSRWAPKEFADGEAGLKQYQDALAKSTLDTLNSMGLPEWAAAMLAEIGDTPTLESLTKVINDISKVKEVLTGVGEVISDVFGNTATSSEDAVIALSKVSGGLDKLATNLSGYYDNFYTKAEKDTLAMNSLSASFANLGQSLPGSRAGFRALVEAAQAAGDSQLLAGLLALQGKFADLYDSADTLSEAVDKSNKEVADSLKNLGKETIDLQVELYNLQGKSGDANQALFLLATEGMTDAEIKVWKFNKTLKDQIEVIKAATKAADDNAKAQSDVYSSTKSNTDSLLNNLESLVSKDKEAQQIILDNAKEKASAMQQVMQTLTDSITALYSSVNSTSKSQYSSARRSISSAITSGVIPSSDVLQKLISTVTTGLDSTKYTSKFEADKSKLIFANELTQLQSIAAPQLSTAEKQLKAAESQITYLDGIYQSAKTQVDTSRGLLTSFTTIEGALKAINESILVETRAQTVALSAALLDGLLKGTSSNVEFLKQYTTLTGKSLTSEQWNSVAGNNVWYSSGGAIAVSNESASGTSSVIKSNTGSMFTIADMIEFVVKNQGNPRLIYDTAIKHGISANSLDTAMNWEQGSSNAWADKMGIPRFELGGMHSGGARIVGENGPELEVTGPARYFTANQTSEMLGDSGDVAAQIELLRYECRATAQNIAKLTRIVERLIVPTTSGEAMQTVAVVA